MHYLTPSSLLYFLLILASATKYMHCQTLRLTGPTEVAIGGDAVFTCTATGAESPSFYWKNGTTGENIFLAGVKASDKERYRNFNVSEAGDTSTMTITGAQIGALLGDDGCYKCQVALVNKTDHICLVVEDTTTTPTTTGTTTTPTTTGTTTTPTTTGTTTYNHWYHYHTYNHWYHYQTYNHWYHRLPTTTGGQVCHSGSMGTCTCTSSPPTLPPCLGFDLIVLIVQSVMQWEASHRKPYRGPWTVSR